VAARVIGLWIRIPLRQWMCHLWVLCIAR